MGGLAGDPRKYYVYIVKVEGKVRYIGSGSKKRYLHAVSGTSSCKQLNEDFLAGKFMEVFIFSENLPEDVARRYENDLIYSCKEDFMGIYNKNVSAGGVYFDDFLAFCPKYPIMMAKNAAKFAPYLYRGFIDYE